MHHGATTTRRLSCPGFVYTTQSRFWLKRLRYVTLTVTLDTKLLTAGWLAGSILEERYGLGRDIWTLEPWQISEFLKIFFVFEVLYTLTLGLIKTSILFLYLRLFPDPKFRRIVWATQAFNLLMVGSFILSDFLQCRPISFFWESWDGEHAGRCFNINAFAWAHSALNIALDFWMLYLPATQVWSLQMKTRKKVGVILMFGIGILWVPPCLPCIAYYIDLGRLTFQSA